MSDESSHSFTEDPNWSHLLRISAKIIDLESKREDTLNATESSLKRRVWTIEEAVELWETTKRLEVVGRNTLVEATGWSIQSLIRYKESGEIPPPMKGQNVVYLLLDGSEVVYIGCTRTAVKRLAQHRKRRRQDSEFQWDSTEFIRCDSEEHARDLEAILQQQHRPKYNKRIEKRTTQGVAV